jgi:hypothetical protein
MKNVNQRRKYSNIKPFNDVCSAALHVAEDRWVPTLAATVRTGAEKDFIKKDPQEKRKLIIERNRRTLDKYYNQAKKTEGFTEMMERLNKISLKRPDESSGKS